MCICTHTYRQAAYHQLPVPSSLYKTQASHPRTPLHSPQPTLKQVPQCSSFFLNKQFKEVNLEQGRGEKPKRRMCGWCPRLPCGPEEGAARRPSPGPSPFARLLHVCFWAAFQQLRVTFHRPCHPLASAEQRNTNPRRPVPAHPAPPTPTSPSKGKQIKTQERLLASRVQQ